MARDFQPASRTKSVAPPPWASHWCPATATKSGVVVAGADAQVAVQRDRGGAAERQGTLPSALAEHQGDHRDAGVHGREAFFIHLQLPDLAARQPT
jgi:hypothetical protein